MAKNKTSNQTLKRFFLRSSWQIIFVLAVFFYAGTARAATLYPSPATGSYNVGQSFSITVYVSSADQSTNAVSGTLSFPKDKLEATSVSKSASVINLWVQEPNFSNTNGTVSFEGIILNPGFKGSNGKVISVSFKTKAAGTANLTFSSGSVLANDGQGTNILSGFGSASLGIEVPTSGPAAPEAETPALTAGVPSAPQVKSSTHPSPDAWYKEKAAAFSWDLPAGTTASQLLVGSKPQATPSVTYTPAINSRQLEALEDGIWYFHVRLRNTQGWGGISHFRFQIDSLLPDNFILETVEEADPTNPVRKFVFSASDQTSGISHYEIQIDDGETLKWLDDGSHIYSTPALGPGRHVLIAKAVDKAGNFVSSFTDFNIQALDPPRIRGYPKELASEEILRVKGQSYPYSQVVMWLQRDKEDPRSASIDTDQDGNFVFVADRRLDDGVYQLWAEALDSRGAKSETSEKLTFMVRVPKIVRVGSFAVSILSVIIPLVALIFLLGFMLLHSWRRLNLLRGRVRVEISDAERVLHREFNTLQRKIKLHLKMWEQIGKRRKLSKEEQRTLAQLQQDLESAERTVKKEIEDIRKELK